MHTYVKTLQKVASRIAPSRILSFEVVHVLKTLQLIKERGHVSRDTLCKKLDLGEGTVKTLVKHLKIYDLVETDNTGTRISEKGNKLLSELELSIPAEMSISTCSIALGKFNYAILLKQMSYVIKTG
jgi:predicted methyltransferase